MSKELEERMLELELEIQQINKALHHANINTNRGLYEKYIVTRTDGKKTSCNYFVLSHKDPYSIPALEAYANACEEKYPLLAKDLKNLVAMIKLVKQSDFLR